MRFYLRLSKSEFGKLEFSELKFYSEMLERDNLKLWKIGAFIGFQMGAGGKQTLKAYLNSWGFGEKAEVLTKEEKEKIIAEVMEDHQKVLARFARGYERVV